MQKVFQVVGVKKTPIIIVIGVSVNSIIYPCFFFFFCARLDYGKWRTDPTVYLKCWFCEQEFNVHDTAIEQIVNDLIREKPPHEKDVAWIR